MDFVLVLLVLLPFVLGILQLGLVLHVRNTVASAAAEGARRAATAESTPAEGLRTAREQWSAAVSDRFVTGSRIENADIEGAAAYRLVVDVAVPALGLGGPAVAFTVSGSAVLEPRSAGVQQ